MVESALCRELQELLPGRVRVGELLKNHTSWRIGGPSEIFVEPVSRAELQLVVSHTHRRQVPLVIIGNGSNLLVTEEGIRGVVVKIGGGLGRIATRDLGITAEAGVKLAKLAAVARDSNMGGFEFSAGIPGTVGGAVVMNAGANGQSICSLVDKVLLLSLEGVFYQKTGREIDFGYRSSVLQTKPAIVVEAEFSCYYRGKNEISAEMEEYFVRRKKTQPLGHPNAGSVFKNPPGDSAGRLIEAAGLKGLRIGDAQISTVHANFIVNLGSARAQDILELIERARERVQGCFGVELQLEIKVLGND
ncbi:MAG: UDP-N-acetylenolpyruvoylglucosamine reductase [Firmicutes bacterium ADurb.Bin456]|nr:MAG: UDP-N-acetylenolpyruvoylglucosamine reductase [Firmicutes bacterium ADurb.Bin456]